MSKKKLKEWEIPMNLSDKERELYGMTTEDKLNNTAKPLKMKEAKQTTPMTFAELVDETVEYYSNNPRSLVLGIGVHGSACKYAGPKGERCAAARLCDESATDLEAMDSQDQCAWTDVHHMATLKPEYAHFTIEQIFDLQNLHDRDWYWLNPYGKSGAVGLNVEGKKAVYRLKLRYK